MSSKKTFINYKKSGFTETLKEFHREDFLSDKDMENEIFIQLKKAKFEYGDTRVYLSNRSSIDFISDREKMNKKKNILRSKLYNHFKKIEGLLRVEASCY
jgi:hypothetical protein